MKKKLILILIVISFKSFAQHPDLQQRWFVQSITINSITTEIPNDPIELPYVYIQFYNTTSGLLGSGNTLNFYPTNCDIGFVGHANYIGTNVLEFIDFTISQDITNCSTEFINFMNSYVDFYNDTITEQFVYNITTETDNSKTMLIINNNGDTISYTDNFFNTAPQELINNTWFLHNLIIDDDNNIPPNSNELPVIPLNFYVDVFSSEACSYLTGGNYFDYNLSQFYLYSIGTNYGLTICDPNYPENNTFTDLYINDFYLNSLPGPFSYEHTINGDTETLTITNSIGNQAIYGNYTLSNQEFISSKFSVYPNPVNDNLIIKEIDNISQNLSISLYNIFGSEIIKTKNRNINMSKLASGIYIIKIKLESGETLTKKIIKQ